MNASYMHMFLEIVYVHIEYDIDGLLQLKPIWWTQPELHLR